MKKEEDVRKEEGKEEETRPLEDEDLETVDGGKMYADCCRGNEPVTIRPPSPRGED